MKKAGEAESYIQNVRVFPTDKKHAAEKHALLLCGFGGNIWQVKRLINKLNRLGYTVTALDFSKVVLSKGDPRLLPQLVDEVTYFAEQTFQKTKKPILLVGISLGALLSLNILRRSSYFDEGVMITGGDIVKVAQRLYGPKIWPQSYEALAKQWQDINMYTDPVKLEGKHLLFVLPKRDRLIDVADVRDEVARQQAHGNDLTLIERRAFGHVGTIIEEAILLPHRTGRYIAHVGRGRLQA
jgi:pimeloyl-ACP methyl ester carboxylesterase